MAARQGFFISYINKNLQKDEDFFKSSVLKNLFETIYKLGPDDDEDKPPYEELIIIDETRHWKELYTPREFRNKNNFIKLQEIYFRIYICFFPFCLLVLKDYNQPDNIRYCCEENKPRNSLVVQW